MSPLHRVSVPTCCPCRTGAGSDSGRSMRRSSAAVCAFSTTAVSASGGSVRDTESVSPMVTGRAGSGSSGAAETRA